MARADPKERRGDKGINVFWIILLAAVMAFLAIAIVLMTSGGETETADAAGEQEVIAGEGDEPPGTASFGAGDVAEGGPTPAADIPGEAGELDEGEPPTGQVDDTREAGTVGAVDADPASEAQRGGSGEAARLVDPDAEEEAAPTEEEAAPEGEGSAPAQEETGSAEDESAPDDEEVVPAE